MQQFRGQGVYRKIFTQREEYAKSLKIYKKACFCSVIRPKTHPLFPENYKPLDSIWSKYGFEKIDQLYMNLSWQDLDKEMESQKSLQVWIKNI